MFINGVFKTVFEKTGDVVLPRKGVIGTVVFPESVKTLQKLDANIEGDAIVYTQGDTLTIVTDSFYLGTSLGEVEVNVLSVDDGFVIDLIHGKIVLPDGDAGWMVVDQDGEIEDLPRFCKIREVTKESLSGHLEMVVRSRYGLVNYDSAREYTENLLFGLILSYTASKGEPMLATKVDSIYEDLGNEKFIFTNYKEVEEEYGNFDENGHEDISEFEEQEVEEEDDEFDMSSLDEED